MVKKRKRVHVDRGDVLDQLGKKPNISSALHPQGIEGKMGSFERHFTHKLVVEDPNYLDAYVMNNDICVLFPKQSLTVVAIDYLVSTDNMSGRRKKGALKIKADSSICNVTLSTGTVIGLKTPVGGQVLEINQLIQSNFEWLLDLECGERYVVIIFPDTKVPSLNQSIDEWRAVQQAIAERSNVCYKWLRGQCVRGDTCKFLHSSAPVPVVDGVASCADEGEEEADGEEEGSQEGNELREKGDQTNELKVELRGSIPN